jgi:hypothetical protein
MCGGVVLYCVIICDAEMVLIYFCMVCVVVIVDLCGVMIGCGNVVPQYVVWFGAVWW